jgi:hypothetical protein
VRGQDPVVDGLGHPLEAVTARKAARLRRLAAAWITERQVTRRRARSTWSGVLRPARGAADVEHVRGVPECRWPDPGVALVGVDGHLVEVEADLGTERAVVQPVGLPDACR